MQNFDRENTQLMKNRKHGTILFLLPNKTGIGHLMAELRNLNTWPLVVIRPDPMAPSILIARGSEPISLGPFQHLSIPPDFDIHFTDAVGKRRLFFESIDESKKICRLFSFVSRAVDSYSEPKGIWRGGAAMLFPNVDYHPSLSLVIDFYVHKSSTTTTFHITTTF